MANDEDKAPLITEDMVLPASISGDELTDVLREITDCNWHIIDVERAVLSCGLKPFNFGAAAAELKLHLDQLMQWHKPLTAELERRLETRSSLEVAYQEIAQRKGLPAPNGLLESAIRYLEASIATAAAMHELANKLDGKAHGEKFGYFAYRALLKEHKKLDKLRQSSIHQLAEIRARD